MHTPGVKAGPGRGQQGILGAHLNTPGSRMTKSSSGNHHRAARGSELGMADRAHLDRTPLGSWKRRKSLEGAEPRFDLRKLLPHITQICAGCRTREEMGKIAIGW